MKSQICVDHDASASVDGPAEWPSHEPGARRRTLRMPSEGFTHAETTKCCELGSCRRDYPGDGLLLRHSVGSGNFASTWPLASGRRPHLARAAVVIFSGLSAAAVAASSAMRGKVIPVALSMSGFLLTALATYGFRSRLVEALGFALLIVAVAWNRSRKRSLPSPPNGSSCALQ